MQDWATMALGFGLANESIKARGDRRGRPKGRRGRRIDDGEALRIMGDLNKKSGGRVPPHKLARLAVGTGRVPLNNAQKLSVIRRLAARWAMQK